MVWLKHALGGPIFMCDGCGQGYLDFKVALSCEEHCRKNGSCSMEISEKAVYRPDE